MNKDYNYDYLMHYGVKGMKWGVRHDKPSLGQRYSSWGRSKSNKNFDKKSSNIEQRRKKRSDENFLKNTKYGNWVDKTSNKRYDAKQKRIAERRAKRNKEFDEFDKFISKKAIRSNFAKGVGQTYRVNEFIENRKSNAWEKLSNKPIVGKAASKKQRTSKENSKFYEKTRKDLVTGNVASAKTKYQKFVRAAFFKNPVGRVYTYSAIKTSPYLKTGQQKATALAEMGLMNNYYSEQERLKKEGKAYSKY